MLLADGGGYDGEHGEDIPGLHNITKLGNVIEVPGSYHDGIGVIVDNLAKGGCKPKGVGYFLQGGGAGSTYFWVRDVDDEPPHGPGHWGVSTQGIHMDHWEVASAVSGHKLVVPTFGDGDAGDGV